MVKPSKAIVVPFAQIEAAFGESVEKEARTEGESIGLSRKISTVGTFVGLSAPLGKTVYLDFSTGYFFGSEQKARVNLGITIFSAKKDTKPFSKIKE